MSIYKADNDDEINLPYNRDGKLLLSCFMPLYLSALFCFLNPGMLSKITHRWCCLAQLKNNNKAACLSFVNAPSKLLNLTLPFFFFCTAGLLRGWLRCALVIDKGQQNPFGLTNNILTMPRQSVWLSLHVKSCAVAGTDTTGHVIWIHSWMLTNQHLGEILVQSQEAWGTLL